MTTRKKSQSDRGKGGGAVGGKKVLPTCRMWLCVKCEEPIGEDDEAIECYRCKEWCHRSCSELTVNQFGCCKEGGNFIQWFCVSCRDCQSDETDSKSRMEVQLGKILLAIESLGQRIVSLETIHSVEELDKRIQNAVDTKVEEYLDEKMEKEKRKLNIIVTNIPESTEETAENRRKDDVERVRNIIGKISDVPRDHIDNPIRLGQIKLGRSGQPRLLKLVVKTEESKKKIMQNAYTLNRNVENPKDRVYINNDNTTAERMKIKKLREEVDERRRRGENDWVVNYRDFKIVKRAVRPDQATARLRELETVPTKMTEVPSSLTGPSKN